MLHRSFHIVTFGCQMNIHDSFWLTSNLQGRGFKEVALDEAGVIILNTCSVRDKPEQKVYNILNRIRHVTKDNPYTFVVVAGCVAQQVGKKFFEKFPQVRLVSGSDGIAMTPEAIERLYLEPDLRLNLTDFTENYLEREFSFFKNDNNHMGIMSPTAYVNIMQGCDNYCTYCIVPYTRGKQKSRGLKAIVEECQKLLTNGVKEIVLLGQNVNAYGMDKNRHSTTEHVSFAKLLRQVASLDGLRRLRFLSPHPKDFTSDVIEVFADFSNICPRLHLPVQSGSDTLLRRMGRNYTMKQYETIITELKEIRPDIAFSTDFIVGFPGETEEDFLQTLTVIDKIGFISSFSFCYSDRPGTRSITFSDKIEQKVKSERLSRLQALQEVYESKWLNSRVGIETTILLETISRRTPEGKISWQGRDPWGDTVNLLLDKPKDIIDTELSIRIVEAKKHSLVAEPLYKNFYKYSA